MVWLDWIDFPLSSQTCCVRLIQWCHVNVAEERFLPVRVLFAIRADIRGTVEQWIHCFQIATGFIAMNVIIMPIHRGRALLIPVPIKHNLTFPIIPYAVYASIIALFLLRRAGKLTCFNQTWYRYLRSTVQNMIFGSCKHSEHGLLTVLIPVLHVWTKHEWDCNSCLVQLCSKCGQFEFNQATNVIVMLVKPQYERLRRALNALLILLSS